MKRRGFIKMLRWLLDPRPFLTAVRLDYRREFQLVAGLLVITVLVSFLAAPHLGIGIQRAGENPGRVPPGRAENNDAGSDPPGLSWEKISRALEEGDTDDLNRIMADLDLNRLMAPTSPHLSELLTRAWFCILVLVVVNSLLCVGLGFILGLYPAGCVISVGMILGLALPGILHGDAGAAPDPAAWLLPVWVVFQLALLLLAIVTLLSAAIGFDMARYITRKHKGKWIRDHLRRGLTTWGTAVVPTILVAMILLAAVFVTAIVLSGDPVVR